MTLARGTSDALALQCRAAGLALPVHEYPFWPGRRFRFDLCWLSHWLAVEIEGVVYSRRRGSTLGGRHVSASGFQRDIEKYAEAAARGWLVLRVLPRHVHDGRALLWVERVLLVRASQLQLPPMITRPRDRTHATPPNRPPAGEVAHRSTPIPTPIPPVGHVARRRPRRPTGVV